ncbi:hypothetical protein Zmor_013569 [Zophobas morio]|uniref:Uncharacterized protein n=1 Tax=Zophobas morio TaxID=2755281 RepID=A0AA38IFV6_9CUCU|nr:hypothetical protein Zmor_013569 [Zophobas morio]
MYVFITVTYILTNNILLVASVVPYYGISMYKIYVIAQIMTKVVWELEAKVYYLLKAFSNCSIIVGLETTIM